MTKNTRAHRPCRVCGAEHTNPMSSSICPPCGYTESVVAMNSRALELARVDAKEALLDDAASVEELKDWIKEFLL